MNNIMDHAPAIRHLARRCAVMKGITKTVGPCMLTATGHDPLSILVRCVVYQQISTSAANSIYNKLATFAKGPPFRAAKLRKMSPEEFRACGISGPKQQTLQAVLDYAAANPKELQAIPDATDDTIREQLVQIKGIGNWSVDMFLMFGLGRPDVLPVGDLGIRKAVMKHWAKTDLATPDEVRAIAEPWRPYRSIASWYLWRSLEPRLHV